MLPSVSKITPAYTYLNNKNYIQWRSSLYIPYIMWLSAWVVTKPFLVITRQSLRMLYLSCFCEIWALCLAFLYIYLCVSWAHITRRVHFFQYMSNFKKEALYRSNPYKNQTSSEVDGKSCQSIKFTLHHPPPPTHVDSFLPSIGQTHIKIKHKVDGKSCQNIKFALHHPSPPTWIPSCIWFLHFLLKFFEQTKI